MRRLAILALALALTTQSIATAAKPPRPREAVATIAVTVSRGGGPAVGLTADDFVVVVDGGSLDPITVEPPLPLAVPVLIDQSESMRPPTRGPGRPLDGELSGALKPGDSVRFGRIGNGVTIDPPVPGITQKDLRNAIKAWPDPEEFAPSPLWDGVLQASRAFGDTSHRHLITLVTDGRSTANHASAEDAARAAIQARAAVSIIDEGRTSVINQDNRNAVAVRSSPVLEWLCRLTGGRYYQDPITLNRAYTPAPAEMLAGAIRDQRFHYRVSFAVPDDGKYHELRVRVTEPGTTVYAPTLVKGS